MPPRDLAAQIIAIRGRSVGCGTSPQDAELVSLRVSQHNPRDVALPDIYARGAEVEQSPDLEGLIRRTKVQVQAILVHAFIRHRDEENPGRYVSGRTDLELGVLIARDDPIQRLGPPLPECTGIMRVDDYLLPRKTHNTILSAGPVKVASGLEGASGLPELDDEFLGAAKGRCWPPLDG